MHALFLLAVIVPNYMTGNTRRFKDFPAVSEEQAGGLSSTAESGAQANNDIFIYNDHNEKGGRNGIACIALAIGNRQFLIVKISVVDPDPQGSETFCRIRIRNSRLWIRIRIRNWT
jgi:hypothetical protein